MMIAWIGDIDLDVYCLDPLHPTSRNTRYIIPINNVTKKTNNKIYINDIVFLKIPNFSRYYISHNGIIYDYKKNRFVSHTLNEDNYHVAKIINDNGIVKTKSIHITIYQSFVGTIPDGYEIDHLISKSVNYLQYLECVTKNENLKRARFNGCYGNHDEDYVRYICELLEKGYHAFEIAKIENISLSGTAYKNYISYIHKILYGDMWKDISKDYNFKKYYERFNGEKRLTTIENL